jgi:hypothetical protein
MGEQMEAVQAAGASPAEMLRRIASTASPARSGHYREGGLRSCKAG